MNAAEPGLDFHPGCPAVPSRPASPLTSQPAPVRQWPLIVAALLCPLRPATAATRTQRASLVRVYLLHLALIVAAALLIAKFVAWNESETTAWVLIRFWNQLGSSYEEPAFVIVGIFALIEAIHLAVAALFTPWGACDEPLRNSFKNSLRQTWLHTAHFLPAIGVVGGSVALLRLIASRWHAAHQFPMFQTATNTSTGIPPLPPEPWYVDEPEFLILITVAAMIAWIVWSLARGIGAPRAAPPIQRPPMCANCGYNLTTMAMESRCPECGSPVFESLGPDAQPGTPWDNRRDGPRQALISWHRTAALALRAPDQLGRRIRVSGAVAHRLFLGLHLPIILFVGGLNLVMSEAIFDGLDRTFRHPAFPICYGSAFGLACAVGSFAVANLGALLVGVMESWWAKRNMLPAATQVACYLATYLLAWEIMGGMLAIVVGALAEAQYFDVFKQLTGVPREFGFIASASIPNLIAATFFLILIARGTKAARYANR